MKFKMKRTSICWDEEESPCAGCTREETTKIIEHRDYVEEHEYYEEPEYFDYKGIPMVRRKVKETIWTRDFATVEDLVAFIRGIGSPIVMTEDSIEIYDDYRE